MAVRRQQSGAACVVPLGEASGIDPARVFVEALVPGRYAISVWRGGRHTFVVTDGVGRGQVAAVARHAFEHHSPDWHDESWTIEVCDVATCRVARAWAADSVRCSETASGL
jgi:hypothetical protein